MNASDVMKYGHFTFLKTIEGLQPSEWIETGACGVWSCKDILAHFASYELLVGDVLVGFVDQNAPHPTLDALFALGDRKFNDDQVDKRKILSVDETMAEYTVGQTRCMDLVAKIPAETLRQPGTLPWYGAEYSLDDVIVYMMYGHKREHSGQIAVFRDRFKR